MVWGAQYEISKAALEVLQSTKDARGRSLQVFKVPLPPNLFISEEEAAGLQVPHVAWLFSVVSSVICNPSLTR